MIMQKKAAYGAAALMFAVGGLTAATGAASAAVKAGGNDKSWVCDVSTAYAECAKGAKGVYAGWNYTDRELVIGDHFGNGHRTVAYVKVSGSGTARFFGPYKKEGTRKKIPADYSSGKSLKVKVCTSISSKAVCSGWSSASTT